MFVSNCLKMGLFHTTILVSLFCTSFSAPQQPEINDQFQLSDPVTVQPVPSAPPVSSAQPEEPIKLKAETVKPIQEIPVVKAKENDNQNQLALSVPVPEVSFSVRVYRLISDPIIKVFKARKVNAVLRNIGTCVVNGAMELFSYYLPAPFMPLIASAAGLVIPFEPVVMLKEKMPVTSYRRAFQTAMNSFLGTFDKYKVDEDYDPYMTRRFNRRFMNDKGKMDKEDN